MLPPDLFHRHHNLVWEYCSGVSGIGDMEVVALSPSFLVHISNTHPQHFGKGMLQVASSDNQVRKRIGVCDEYWGYTHLPTIHVNVEWAWRKGHDEYSPR